MPRHAQPRVIWLVALVCLAATAVAAAADEQLVGASSDEHLWFVVPPVRASDPIVLRHHARASGGAYYTRGIELGRLPEAMPEAIAAWDDRLWLVFSARSRDDQVTRRQVFTVRVRRDPSFGAYYYDPPDRLDIMPPLEGEGRLAGFAGTENGPVALLVGQTAPVPAVRARRGDTDEPSLLALSGAQWKPIELPEGFRGDSAARLATSGPKGRLVLAEPSVTRDGATVWWQDGDGGWSATEAAIDFDRVVGLTRVGPALVTVQAEPSGQVDLSYLRTSVVLPLSSFVTGSARWVVLGLRDGPRMISLPPSGEPVLRRIDPITGNAGEPSVMSSQRLVASRIWHLPLLAALTIVAVLVVFLFRPNPQHAPPLPASLQQVMPLARIIAVAIDLVVSGVVVMLVMGLRSPEPLIKLPIWTPDVEAASPALLMIAITTCHSMLSELITGRTLGKLLVGIRTTALDGSKARPGPIIVRNLIKMVVLLIPILVVAALFHPHGQGFADQLARTVVVRPNTEGDKDR